MATQHPCGALPAFPDVALPTSVDAFLEKAMGGPAVHMLKGAHNDSTMFRVEVDLRDLALLAGPEWRMLFAKVTNAKLQRIEAGHAND